MEPIPKYIAWELCDRIWEENRNKWYTLAGWRCRFCSVLGDHSPANKRVSSRADYRGCELVNARYEREYATHDSNDNRLLWQRH